MYSAIEVAKYVINRSQEIDSPVSNLKLQKILFYIQAAMLVKLKKPCFRDEIIAWTYGPVIKEVYDFCIIIQKQKILSTSILNPVHINCRVIKPFFLPTNHLSP